jgi:hypothetical protein
MKIVWMKDGFLAGRDREEAAKKNFFFFVASKKKIKKKKKNLRPRFAVFLPVVLFSAGPSSN